MSTGTTHAAVSSGGTNVLALLDRRVPTSFSIGLGWIMLCFAGIALIAIGFIYWFLPETKNRSVEEITQLFERQAAGDRRAGLTSANDADAAAA